MILDIWQQEENLSCMAACEFLLIEVFTMLGFALFALLIFMLVAGWNIRSVFLNHKPCSFLMYQNPHIELSDPHLRVVGT